MTNTVTNTVKTLIAALTATVAVAFAFPAQADSSMSFVVQGTIDVVCEASGNGIDSTEIINLNSTSEQSVGSVTYTCNNAGGFTRTISSANAGRLMNGNNSIDYKVSHGGGNGLAFGAEKLSSAKRTNHNGSNAFANGQTGSLKVQVPSLPSGLTAGNYSDTITIAIAAN